MDTIFAVSSGTPPAAIAVLRLSGPAALHAAERLCRHLPAPRVAAVRQLRDPPSGDLLDRALVLVFSGARSATGEDLVEFHLHGGRAVVRAVESALTTIPGLRRAEPGEFTRRALANGRIDLTEAEGLGDLLMAETEAQRRAALLSAEGGLRQRVDAWTRELIGLAAAVEALLDHGDEDDVASQGETLATLHAGALALAGDIDTLLAQPAVERLRDGIRVVLAGPPNAGKSTLFNALAERDAAIVSPVAGTTRDRIEVPVVRDGIAWLLIDTAGLAVATDDPVEAIGIARAEQAMAAADIILWLGDDMPPAGAIGVHARIDVPGREAGSPGRIAVSALTGDGLDRLWEELADRAKDLLPALDLPALNQRQRGLAGAAAAALRRAAEECDELLFAEHLRTARVAFDRITGAADVEALLDALFGRFCIGK